MIFKRNFGISHFMLIGFGLVAEIQNASLYHTAMIYLIAELVIS